MTVVWVGSDPTICPSAFENVQIPKNNAHYVLHIDKNDTGLLSHSRELVGVSSFKIPAVANLARDPPPRIPERWADGRGLESDLKPLGSLLSWVNRAGKGKKDFAPSWGPDWAPEKLGDLFSLTKLYLHDKGLSGPFFFSHGFFCLSAPYDQPIFLLNFTQASSLNPWETWGICST
jgi:hypothetical protein